MNVWHFCFAKFYLNTACLGAILDLMQYYLRLVHSISGLAPSCRRVDFILENFIQLLYRVFRKICVFSEFTATLSSPTSL